MQACALNPQPGDWRVVAASVRGTSHQKANLPCQDVLLWRLLPERRLLAALADGAGSASFAEVGAETAARTALESLAQRLTAPTPPATDDEWKAALRDALQAGRSAVLAEADRRQVRPRELASTLLIFAAIPTLAAAAQIGDGAVLLAESPESPRTLTKPVITEYLNETTFLTADAALDQAQFDVQHVPVRYAALLCDGLQLLALKLPEGTPHPRFFQPLFGFLDGAADLANAADQLKAFLQSPRITARADDDLSLLLAGLRPAPPVQRTPGPACGP